MHDTHAIALNAEEYAELKRLVEAQGRGEDVQYAAFSALCPTGAEGAFDERMCVVYDRLAREGLIEGASEGEAFYFEGLTQEGVEYVEARDADEDWERRQAAWGAESGDVDAFGADEALEPLPIEQGDQAASEVRTADAAGNESEASHEGFAKHAPLDVRLVAIAAAAGFAAGLIGGALGAFGASALL